jgi:hypothetical protein
MSAIEVTARSKKTNREVTFERDFGDNIAQACELFGDEVVFSIFQAQCVIRAQGAARTVLDKPENTPDEALEAGKTYKPGVVRRVPGGSAKRQVLEAIAQGKMSTADIRAFVSALMAAANSEDTVEDADSAE